MLECGQSAGKVLSMNKINKISNADGNYISGFSDGEGSFNISFKERNDYKRRIKITASFNISQKDKKILVWIKSIINCGTLRTRKDGIHYFEVTDVESLINVVIPFFSRFPLKSSKAETFKIFCEIVSMMDSKFHLTSKGILKIFDLRELIQVGRKRKHTREQLLEILSSY
jgi:hypothetical protein